MTTDTDIQEIEDLITDAISDSLEMDWTARDGAKAVVRALTEEGWPGLRRKLVEPGTGLAKKLRDRAAQTWAKMGTILPMKLLDEEAADELDRLRAELAEAEANINLKAAFIEATINQLAQRDQELFEARKEPEQIVAWLESLP